MLVIVQSRNLDTHLQSHAFIETHLQSHAFIEAHSFNPQLFSSRLFFSGEGLGMAKHQQRPQKPSYANISLTQFLSTLTVALPLQEIDHPSYIKANNGWHQWDGNDTQYYTDGTLPGDHRFQTSNFIIVFPHP